MHSKTTMSSALEMRAILWYLVENILWSFIYVFLAWVGDYVTDNFLSSLVDSREKPQAVGFYFCLP